MSVEYFDQLLSAARQVHVVYLAQLLGAVLLIHFISNHDNSKITLQVLHLLPSTRGLQAHTPEVKLHWERSDPLGWQSQPNQEN